MIRLQYGTNLDRKEELVDGTMTPKELWQQFGMSLEVGVLALDGVPLNTEEYNTPLGDLIGNSDNAILIQVVKTSNG